MKPFSPETNRWIADLAWITALFAVQLNILYILWMLFFA